MAKMESKTTRILFEKEKETKNTIKYQEKVEAGKPAIIGTLYVQKWFAEDADALMVIIEK